MENQNNNLTQKTFEKSAIGSNQVVKKPKTLTNTINNTNNIRPAKLINNQPQNTTNKVTSKISLFGVISVVLFIAFLVFNYLVLSKMGFSPQNKLDIAELIAMVLIGALNGVSFFWSQFERSEGYLIKAVISFLFGFFGNVIGLVVTFIICLIIYLVVSIVGWFFK